MQFPDFGDPAIWISLLTLTFLEIVLGVDNIIFISIVSSKLREEAQEKARKLGLMLAMFFRIGLLLTITWIIRLTTPLFTISFIKGHDKLPIGISWKDIILFAGGVFLIAKSTLEIHHKLEQSSQPESARTYSGFSAVIVQIILVDAVFSFDSILTAIGLVENVIIMIIAVVISMLVMIGYSGIITRFINKNPTFQMLALTFLIVIGILLVAEAFHQTISKSYVYTAIAFSLTVELLNSLQQLTVNTSLQIIDGNKVLEIRMTGIDKGITATKLINMFRPDFILCMGDDTTDEDMFRTLEDKAVTIKVGNSASSARYNILSQEDVLPFLQQFVKATKPERQNEKSAV